MYVFSNEILFVGKDFCKPRSQGRRLAKSANEYHFLNIVNDDT
jgi:hypothetical protein